MSVWKTSRKSDSGWGYVKKERGKEMAGSVTKLESSSSSDESGIRTCNQGFGGAGHVRQQQQQQFLLLRVEPQSAMPDSPRVVTSLLKPQREE